jgi:F420-0:gamma-glutamyl ligase
MNIQKITTKQISAGDDLYVIFQESLPLVILDDSFLCISSKIIALCEGSVVAKADVINKDDLIIKHAEAYLPRVYTPGGYVMHTVKNNMIMPTAGIDSSNGGNNYVLLPKDSYVSAQQIYHWVQKKYDLKNLGIIITDSRSQVLRNGVVGYALSFYGFNPIRNYRGTKDLFGNKMNFSQSNIPDALAAASVLSMGEGNEGTPIAIISGIHGAIFGSEFGPELFEINKKDDIYFEPFFSKAPWIYKKTD